MSSSSYNNALIAISGYCHLIEMTFVILKDDENLPAGKFNTADG
ncbi:hypothetical protein [Cytobacillus gottheilii]|nr:hypothetical protein [Cytobacillus gottheilii]